MPWAEISYLPSASGPREALEGEVYCGAANAVAARSRIEVTTFILDSWLSGAQRGKLCRKGGASGAGGVGE
jgi:hypothetical protein